MDALVTLRSLIPPAVPAALQRVQWPFAVSAIAAVLIGLQVATLLTDFFGASEPPPAMQSAPPQAAPAPRLNLQALVAARVFGAAAAGETDLSQAPATSLSLVLTGVIAATDPRGGFAILGTDQPSARLHAIGATVPGGATLHSVYPDRVVLERGGALETLTLPKRALAGLAPVSQAPQPQRQPQPELPSEPMADPQLEQMRQAMQRNPTALSEVIRAQQVIAGGRQRGFRVYPGNNPRAFSRLGLRPGDLVTAVDGTPLDDPERSAEVMQTLGSAAEARVTIQRNGKDTDLVLNLAAIANDLAQPPPAPGPGRE